MSLFSKKPRAQHEWYNPKPESIGEVVAQIISPDGQHKSVVIRTKENTFCVYMYERDESDIESGMSDAVGWIAHSGPSITDSIERAQALAAEYLRKEVRTS